jgi:hypothetical protein
MSEYDRKRAQQPARKRYMKRYLKEYRKLHQEKFSQNVKRWDRRNPEKRRAYWTVKHALDKKLLTKQPCEVCGKKKVEAHHQNYSKPLAVTWLCVEHHKEIHRQQKETA